MTSERIQAVLDKVESCREPLRDAATRLGESGLEGKTLAGWTAKEMLAHVAFWEEAVFGVVTTMFRPGPPPEGWTFGSGYLPGDDWPRAYVHNAREAQWARGKVAREVLDRWDKAYAQMRDILATVTDEEFDANAKYLTGLGDHYQEHVPELEALLAQETAR